MDEADDRLWQDWRRRHDDGAFETLVRPHLAFARDLARRRGLDDTEADDVVQEALARLAREPSDRPVSVGLRAWLGRDVSLRSRMWLRARGRRRRHEHAAAAAVRPPEERPGGQGLEELEHALDALPPAQREVVVLRYLHDLEYREIAHLLRVPETTCRTRVHRALETLRRRLGPVAPALLAFLPTAPPPPIEIVGAALAKAAASGGGGAGGWLKAAGVAAAVLAVVGGAVALLPREHAPPGAASPELQEVAGGAGAGQGSSEPASPGAPGARGAAGRGSPGPEGGPTQGDGDVAPVPSAPPASVRVPAGMVWVPGGEVEIGTEERELRHLLNGHADHVVAEMIHETPRHKVSVTGFALDKYEVTNAQYALFLRDAATRTLDTNEEQGLANLQEVVGFLLSRDRTEWNKNDVGWRQLYRHPPNRAQLWEKMPQFVRKDAAGNVDERATEQAFERAPLARGLELTFYDRQPPRHWPTTEPSEEQRDHPVRWVSYDDAEAYAEWAGKHIPTEAEWEWAAAGPSGFPYPWGTEWYQDASRANWGGKVTVNQDPSTLLVDSLPEGRSWVGAHHMLGNVSEWTSSWFLAYPGNERTHEYMGDDPGFVKVIRGGSLVDQGNLPLRLQARNFRAFGVRGAPQPHNRFEWVGLRCAWYPTPGMDALEPMMRRVERARRLTRHHVDASRVVGAVSTRFLEPGTQSEHHVYVTGRAHAIVVVPVDRFFDARRHRDPGWRPPRLDDVQDFAREIAASPEPLPLAVLHLGVGLAEVFVRDPAAPPPAPRRRRGDGPEAIPTVRGEVAPGTYVLALWRLRTCLVAPDLGFVAWLGDPSTEERSIFDVHPSEAGAEPRPTAALDLDVPTDRVEIRVTLPLGARDPRLVLDAAVSLRVLEGALAAAGPWAR